MPFLRALLFSIIFYPVSAFLAILVALAAPFTPRLLWWGSHQWARWFIGCARLFHGIRLHVRGVVPQHAVIVAMKHQSAYETLLTLYLFERPAVVMKAELRNIPFWGYASMRHGSIFVERGKSGAALKGMLRQARARAADRRPIILFPEGTRVPLGEAPPLKAGLYGVYHGTGLAVVPVALDAGRLWPKGFLKTPGTVTLAFQPDVPASLAREEMEARVHAAINADPVTVAVRTL
jgi:1-acyl-sn-glycerol-3-phosphate acyltransferase